MSCLETHAAVRIFSPSLALADIGRILDISATEQRAMDPSAKYRSRREHHYWNWSTQGAVESVQGIDHVRALIEILKRKEPQLAQLRAAGCEIDVCCYWVSSGQGGPWLDVPALTALAQLGLEIWWDIYFGSAAEYAPNSSK